MWGGGQGAGWGREKELLEQFLPLHLLFFFTDQEEETKSRGQDGGEARWEEFKCVV